MALLIRPQLENTKLFKLVGLWVENDRRKRCLSALPCRLKGTPLISSTVKNVEDICAVAGLAVVEEVLPGREAPHRQLRARLRTTNDFFGSFAEVDPIPQRARVFDKSGGPRCVIFRCLWRIVCAKSIQKVDLAAKDKHRPFQRLPKKQRHGSILL
jgi:hypothetical protein